MFFFTQNEIGKRNNAKNIELQQNWAIFSYVKRKLLNRSKAENLKRKNRLEFRCALFHFEAKIIKVKRSKKFEAKTSKKIEVKFYSEIAKHMWNRSNFALFRL